MATARHVSFLIRPSGKQPMPLPTRDEGTAPGPHCVLVVDDEEKVRLLLSRILRRAGYNVALASDAAQARDMMARDPFDVILCDLTMPGESGMDLARWTIDTYPETAVVIVSVLSDPQMADRALEMGVYGYIPKPFSPETILINVAGALRRRGLEAENRKYREDLEQLVKERTADLHSTIRSLRETQRALKESQERYRNLFQRIPLALFRTTPDGRVLDANPALLEMLGFESKEELCRTNVAELYVEPSARLKWKQFITRSGVLKGFQKKLRRRDGGVLWVEEHTFAVKDAKGGVICFEGSLQDVTQRKLMEDALRKARDEKEIIFSAISSILIGVSSGGLVTEWNKTASAILGIPRETALGGTFEDLPLSCDIPKIMQGIRTCLESRRAVRLDDLAFTRPDGKEGLLGLSLSPIEQPGADPDGVLILGADITERRLMERQLAQAQKLESIGQLAAGIAHEINTPIQYVGDNTRFLRDAFQEILHLMDQALALVNTLETGQSSSTALAASFCEAAIKADLDYLREEIPKATDQTVEGVERVAKIVRALKEFSHPGNREHTAVDINKALESTIVVSRNEWKYVADLVTDLDPALPTVHCDPGELNQVFLNLLVNAAHAITDVVSKGQGERGRITVSTHGDGPWVEVRIQDTGTGIPEEIRPRIFDPFFTTKEVGRGTGQGLAICYSVIVKKLGGRLDFETEVGKGTTFIVRLPASGQGPGGPDGDEEEGALRG